MAAGRAPKVLGVEADEKNAMVVMFHDAVMLQNIGSQTIVVGCRCYAKGSVMRLNCCNSGLEC